MQEGRYRLPSDLSGLLRSEWDRIIEEANFDEIDEGIVRDCIMDRCSQAYAASGIDRTRLRFMGRFGADLYRIWQFGSGKNE